MPRSASITDEAAVVLDRATVDDCLVHLPPEQLDRETYAAVNRVLETLGGKWDRKARAHRFKNPVGDRLTVALREGVAQRDPANLTPADEAHARQQALGFFRTPEALAERMSRWVVRDGGGVYLEPEAGDGRLARAALEDGADYLVGVEFDPANYATLTGDPVLNEDPQRVEWHQGDFLAAHNDWFLPRCMGAAGPGVPYCGGFDGVLMNPPFARNADIEHVTAAASLLKPGGRLAAIVSEHAFTARERLCTWFRNRLATRGATVEALPEGTFADEGTRVSARLVLLERAA